MSQYNFSVSSCVGDVIVSVGWDKQLQHFFMSIYKKTEDDPIYDNLFEPSPFQLTLEHYQNILNQFSINDISLFPSSKLYEQLIADRLI